MTGKGLQEALLSLGRRGRGQRAELGKTLKRVAFLSLGEEGEEAAESETPDPG